LHLHRVQTYAIELGKDFGLSPGEMEGLQAAAILHDVGKLAVPEHIISKPGKLTPDEFAKMKIHTVVGAEIVERVNFPFVVAPLVRSHHEKWDGSGYPDGLKGEEIPIGARILSAVDCLDALASDRQYRKAMPIEKAMSIIVAESGKAFDPRVVEALQKRFQELENLATATQQIDTVKLSVNATVDRGFAPDAGYAVGTQPQPLTAEELAREALRIDSITSRIGQFDSAEADLLAIEPILRELIPFDCLALYRRRGDDQLECVLAIGESAPLLRGLTIESGVGISGWTVANRTPLMNGNAATEFGVVGTVNPQFSLTSGLSIPLESETGAIGTFTIYSCRRDAFELSHLRALLAISSRLSYQANLDFSGNTPRQARPAPASQIRRLAEAVDLASHQPSIVGC
jgi:putative nucleotidyltransferase with HDIG domain